MSTLQSGGQRAIGDLLSGERAMRGRVEGTLRDLRQLLLELAVRFDGQRLEQLRSKDPTVPTSWTPADWSRFFAQVHPAISTTWGGGENAQALRELQQQVEGYKEQIKTLGAQLAQANLALKEVQEKKSQEQTRPREVQKTPRKQKSSRPASKPVSGPQVDPTAKSEARPIPPPGALVAELKRITPEGHAMQDAPLNQSLLNGERRGGDLLRARQRFWMGLYLIGHWGLSARLEIDDVLSAVSGISASTGSLQRVLGDLEKAGLLRYATWSLAEPETALKLFQLSEEGRRIYQSLLGQAATESEWERLARLRGDEKEHILAVLLCAMHARKRGWSAQVLPEVEGVFKPDLKVARGEETYFVKVALREEIFRWPELAVLNQEKVALCAGTSGLREKLVQVCKEKKLPGLAVDLESLIQVKYTSINAKTPLWLELW